MTKAAPRRVAVCAGSFDPVTNGHVDIIRRARGLFDRVIVAVGVNGAKGGTLFTVEERQAILRETIAAEGFEEVEVDVFSGLLIDYARSRRACAIIRGLRAVTDFEYEFQIGLANMDMNGEIETVFLLTDPANIFLSSSLVKEIARHGGDVSRYLPEPAMRALRAKQSLPAE